MAKRKYGAVDTGHHVVRRCHPQRIIWSADDKPIGLFPAAMRLRPHIQEKYLSVNWLEGHEGDKQQKLKSIAAVHRTKITGTHGPKVGLAILKVSRVIDIGNEREKSLTVRHNGTDGDPTYSKISGLPLDNSDELLTAALAEEAFKDFITLGMLER